MRDRCPHGAVDRRNAGRWLPAASLIKVLISVALWEGVRQAGSTLTARSRCAISASTIPTRWSRVSIPAPSYAGAISTC